MRRLAMALIICGVVPGLLYGQRTSATISGTVSDQSGAVVPNAEISVVQSSTGTVYKGQSHNDGFYVIPNLAPGQYQLRCELTGFQPYVNVGLTIQVGQAMTMNIVLKLGSQTETVTVSGAASTVDTRTQTLNTSISPQFARDLPLNGRNVLQLLLVSPEVSPATTSLFAQTATRPETRSTFASATGGRSNGTAFYLDGASNEDPYTNVANIFPNPDAIQEFTYTTNNASAKFQGRGGGVVSAVTRGGTNDFHGTLFEFLRNNALNARNFFAPINDGQKRNQYGVSGGGPIRKDKSFFFVSWQGTKIRSRPTANVASTPTEAMRNGDFSAIARQLVDPNNGISFVGNQIPLSRLDPLALKVLQSVPVSDPQSGVTFYSTRIKQDDNQWVVRLDHNFGEKFRLYGRYLYDRLFQPGLSDTSNYLTAAHDFLWKSQNLGLNADYIVSPNLVANLTATYNRVNSDRRGPEGFLGWSELGARVPNLVGGNGSGTAMEMAVGGYFGIDWGAYLRIPRNVYNLNSNWTNVRRKHTIEFGGEITKEQNLLGQDRLSEGYYEFSNQFSGNNLVDFMLGRPSLFLQSQPVYNSLRRTLPALYVSDTWKATRKLSLSLGVRWNPWVPFRDTIASQTHQFSQSAFFAGTRSSKYPNLPPGLLVGGDPGVPDSGIHRRYDLFDPRVGFAYDIFGDGKTSLRGGYGIYHDQPMGVMNNDQLSIPPYGFLASISPPASLGDPYAGQINPFPFPTPPPASLNFPTPFSVEAYDPSFTDPTIQQWNLTLERQLPSDFMLRVAYEGSQSYHLFGGVQGNAAVYIPGGSTLSNVQQRRPMQPYSGVVLFKSIGTASYNGMSISVQKSMEKGLSVLAGFRWAKNLDHSSAFNGNGSTYTSTDISIDRGRSDNDINEQFMMSYVWTIPTPSSLSNVGRMILGGWQTSGILTLRAGVPFSVLSGRNNALDGISGDRAQLVGDPDMSSGRPTGDKLLQWFNTKAFSPNPEGTKLGGLRNILRGPGFANLDFGVNRSFSIKSGRFAETQRIDFRVESFNLFNRANFNNPVNNLSSGTFGRVLSAKDPRILQFALKYSF